METLLHLRISGICTFEINLTWHLRPTHAGDSPWSACREKPPCNGRFGCPWLRRLVLKKRFKCCQSLGKAPGIAGSKPREDWPSLVWQTSCTKCINITWKSYQMPKHFPKQSYISHWILTHKILLKSMLQSCQGDPSAATCSEESKSQGTLD